MSAWAGIRPLVKERKINGDSEPKPFPGIKASLISGF